MRRFQDAIEVVCPPVIPCGSADWHHKTAPCLRRRIRRSKGLPLWSSAEEAAVKPHLLAMAAAGAAAGVVQPGRRRLPGSPTDP